MRFDKPVPLTTIASLIGADLVGNTSAAATGINEIHKVEEGDLVFVDHPKYYEKCIQSAASFIIINKHTSFPEEKALLVTPDPFEAYQTIVRHFRPFAPSMQLMSPSSLVGEGTIIMPNSYIGNHVSIGKNCIIHPSVTILDHCVIGDIADICQLHQSRSHCLRATDWCRSL